MRKEESAWNGDRPNPLHYQRGSANPCMYACMQLEAQIEKGTYVEFTEEEEKEDGAAAAAAFTTYLVTSRDSSPWALQWETNKYDELIPFQVHRSKGRNGDSRSNRIQSAFLLGVQFTLYN